MSRRPPSARDPQRALIGRTMPAVNRLVQGHLQARSAAPLPRPLPNRQSPGKASTGVALDTLIKQGPAGVATNVFPTGTRVPTAFTTTSWVLRCNASHTPTGSACTVLVKRSGTTLATISIAAGASTGTVATAVALAAGDLLTYDITSVGATTPAWDVACQIVGA